MARLWTALAFLSIVGTVLRALAITSSVEHGEHVAGDSLSFLFVADTIRDVVFSGGAVDWRLNGLFVRGPLYPLFVLALGGGTDRPVTPILGANLLLGALTCVLTFVLGARLAGRHVGLIACALVAATPALINVPATVMSEAVRVPLVLATLLAMDQVRRNPRLPVALSMGALVAVFAFSHQSTVLVPVALLVWAWFFVRPHRMIAALAAPCAGAGLVWLIASQAWFGELVPFGVGGRGFAGGGAWTALVGSRPETDGQILPHDYEYVDLPLTPRLLERMASDGSDPSLPPLEPEVAAWISDRGIQQPIPDAVFWRAWRNRLLKDPAGFTWLTLRKAWRLAADPRHGPPGAFLARSGPIPDSQPFQVAVLGLALVGLAVPSSLLAGSARLLLAMIPVYLIVVYSLTATQSRYWTLALPLVSIGAAVGSLTLIRSVRALTNRCTQITIARPDSFVAGHESSTEPASSPPPRE